MLCGMKNSLRGALIASGAFWGVLSNTQALSAELVLPPRFSGVEDDGWSGVLSTAMRLQEVYGATAFPDEPVIIESLSFRLDASQETSISLTIPNITISLSTTKKAPDSLSPTFQHNLGLDTTVVFSGPLNVNARGGFSPNPFDIVVPFTVPFYFDPSHGNLLVDIKNFTSSPTTWLVDASNDLDDNASRIFDYNPNAATAAQVDTGADIVRLNYTVVPEPSVQNLLVLGLGLAFFLRRSSIAR